MTNSPRIAALRYAMIAIGVTFIFGIDTLVHVWPSGWAWGAHPSHYLPMLLGVYVTLGVFLIRASRDPLANRSLIWFTVWSNVVHALVMAVEAVAERAERGHLIGDVPALLLLAAVLTVLTRRAASNPAVRDLGLRRAA